MCAYFTLQKPLLTPYYSLIIEGYLCNVYTYTSKWYRPLYVNTCEARYIKGLHSFFYVKLGHVYNTFLKRRRFSIDIVIENGSQLTLSLLIIYSQLTHNLLSAYS